MKSTLALDTGGVVISSLCLVHCLVLPFLGTLLPVLGVWSEIEWVHKVLVLTALPLCLNLVFRTDKLRLRLPAIVGFSLLMAGAFVEALHDFETILTITGALFLGLAHLQNIGRARHGH